MQADTEDDTSSPVPAKDQPNSDMVEEGNDKMNGGEGGGDENRNEVNVSGPSMTLPPLGGNVGGGAADSVSTSGLGGADSTASSTSGILTDASSTGIPSSSVTPGVGGPDEEVSEVVVTSKTEVGEQIDTTTTTTTTSTDDVDDTTPTDRQAPSLDEGDVVMEAAPSAAAEVSDQPPSLAPVEAGGAGEDLSSTSASDLADAAVAPPAAPLAVPVPSAAPPASPLAVVDSCPTSDFATPLEGAVPMEEEDDLYGPAAATAVHSGLQRPTTLPMHSGVQLGTGPPVVMSATPYGPTTYLDNCGVFGPTQAPSTNGLPPNCGGGGSSEHYVMVHINAGETFSVRMGDQLQHITGPATVRMVSNNGPPVPMPMQVPPGHMVQQIVDETGILTHVILSPHPTPTPGGPPAGPPPPQIGPPPGPQSGPAASVAQNPGGYYSHPHHHPGSAGSPGLYSQPYGGPPTYGGPAGGPNSTNGPPPGCPSPHRHQHYYCGQQSGQGGYMHSQQAIVSTSGGVNNGGQSISHCNGPSSGVHETRAERTKARLQARLNKRQQQQHQQSSSSTAYGSHHHIHAPHHHGYHSYHSHDRRQYPSGPSQANSHHNNVGSSGSRMNGDLSPHRLGGGGSGHYPEDASSLSGGEEVALNSSSLSGGDAGGNSGGGGGGGGHFHPGSAHHHSSHLHHSHSRHHHQSGPAPTPPAAQQPCSLTEDERRYVQMLLSSMPQPKVSDVEGRRALIQIVPPEPSTFDPSTSSSSAPTDGSGNEADNTSSSNNKSSSNEETNEEESCCTVPPDLDPYDFVFELHLSEKGAEGKYDLVFRDALRGEATEISLRDLKPACEYHVKIRCLYEHVKGDMTRPVRFMTEAAEPNAPRPPLIGSKSKNSLNLRWAPNGDNGAKITSFLLHWDGGNDSLAPADFCELYSGPQRNYRLTKLTASTDYRFRLAAANCRGTSEFSDVVVYTTSGTAPAVPDSPTLSKQHVKALTIAWVRRPSDMTFSLQMEDKSTSHGFLPVYHGPELSYTITNLRRNTEYQFRLAANNEEGSSKWSQIVSYRTLPDRPCPPTRLQPKGKVRPDHFKVIWEAPDDDGGSEVQLYAIEISQDASSSGDSSNHANTSSWSRVYEGTELECLCSNLRPGRSVRVRGFCQSAGGWSEPSTVLPVPLPPVVPSACPAPQLQGKPKAISLLLVWQPPDDDGGAPITNYEVKQEPSETSPAVSSPADEEPEGGEREEKAADKELSSESRVVYSGRATTCTVAGLRPGRGYLYLVRAFNKAGYGPWSSPLRVTSGPGVPDAPKAPCVVCRSPHSAVITWQAPVCNGADITEYRLEWQPRPEQDFTMLFTGDALSYEVKGLQPVSTYSFRVLAHNAAGSSAFSPVCQCRTPPGPPGQINSLRPGSVTAHSVLLQWQRPADNGADITSYHIDMGERQIVTIMADRACSDNSSQLEYCVDGLSPETTFKLRIQAVNAIGVGVLSSPIKVTTLALPPTAPQHIECTQAQANAIKVRWGDGGKATPTTLGSSSSSGGLGLLTGLSGTSSSGVELTQYTLEISRQPDAGWQIAYVGTGHTHKVARLHEMTEYYFRVIASNEAGQGEPSPVHAFSTTKALPPAVRAPRITELTADSCRVEWSPLKPMGQDRLLYIMQLLFVNGRNADYRQLCRNYKEVYRGTETSCRLTCLQEGTEYLVRVAAIRQCLSTPTVTGASRLDARSSNSAEESAASGSNDASVSPVTGGGSTSTSLPPVLGGDAAFSIQAASSGNAGAASTGDASNTLSNEAGNGAQANLDAPSAVTYEELIGPFSQGVAFTTRGPSRRGGAGGPGGAGAGGLGVSGGAGDASETRGGVAALLATLLSLRVPGTLSDQQWAVLILLGFACLTCLIAFLLQHLLFANESGADSL